MRLVYILIICVSFLSACVKRENAGGTSEQNAQDNIEVEAAAEEKPDPLFTRAAEIASSLNDQLLAAQILISGIDGKRTLPAHIKNLLTEYPAGGIMLFRYNLDTDNDSIRLFLAEISSMIKTENDIPPFLAVDHEGGSVNRFSRGVAALPAASSYGILFIEHGKEAAIKKIEEDALRAGGEIASLGINMNFAPVAEYLTDDNISFLQSRSYGSDPSFTAEAAEAFARSMEQAGVLCVIKHFPGIAGADPHYSASVLSGDRTELDRLVSPFAYLIENGAKAVMVSHSAVPAVDDKIASLSSAVMEDWLRRDLGFAGIIIADDFSMAAAGNTNPAEAAVRSVAAGADMILVWQKDLKRTHNAFISALQDGRLSRERLQEAARRIIYEKLKMGLMN